MQQEIGWLFVFNVFGAKREIGMDNVGSQVGGPGAIVMGLNLQRSNKTGAGPLAHARYCQPFQLWQAPAGAGDPAPART
jgi:hypothetical protein